MEDGKLNVAQLHGCGHGDASVFGNAPAAGVRNLCNESVSVATFENARGFGAPTLRIGDTVQVRGVLEYLPDVRIGETADHMLACQQGTKDLDLVAGDGIERISGSLGSNLKADRARQPNPPLWLRPLAALEDSSGAARLFRGFRDVV